MAGGLETARIADEIEQYKQRLKSSERAGDSRVLGLSVLNAEYPTETAKRFRQAMGKLSFDYIARDCYWLGGPFVDKGIYPIFRICHQLPDGKLGEFDGGVVAEDFHGPVYALLLVPRRDAAEHLEGGV
jgi:hypothetical protein